MFNIDVDCLGEKLMDLVKRTTLNGKVEVKAECLPLIAMPARNAI
jgi:hypothetical protein